MRALVAAFFRRCASRAAILRRKVLPTTHRHAGDFAVAHHRQLTANVRVRVERLISRAASTGSMLKLGAGSDYRFRRSPHTVEQLPRPLAIARRQTRCD